jgi:hypothetical protein
LNAFDLDFQNKVDDFPKDYGLGGPRVKCWSSPLSKTKENSAFKQYSLQLGYRCEDVEKCRAGDVPLPIINYQKDGVIQLAEANLTAPVDTASGDSVQIARFEFESPTIDYNTQLPDPFIFWITDHPDAEIKRKDRTVRFDIHSCDLG